MARKPRKVIAPDMPPPTEAEIAMKRKTLSLLHGLADQLQQRNLDNAVLLAQQAARGRGPLVDWFAEIGRRFGRELDKPEKPKPPVVK